MLAIQGGLVGAAAADSAVTSPARKDAEWWKHTGNPRGQWWLTHPNYQPDAANDIWKRVPIPPSPVLPPASALATFRLPPELRIELVAAEPLIVRPVYFRFDSAGRLWVVEMPGYMRDIDGAGEDDPTGRVVVLEDTDADGRMDKSTVFMDQLRMPRTLSFVSGGVLVAEPPNIWYARDTNGDLVADEKTLVATDYGERGNPEHSANGLMRAIDNWMYSAKSAVRHRFKDGRLLGEPTLYRGQWGITQDDAGRLYHNYNPSPLHTDLVPTEHLWFGPGSDLARPRSAASRSPLNLSLVDDKSLHPARVTPLVTLGASDLRPDGTLKKYSAACSPHIYRGDGLPAEFRGNAFVCDPVGNLVSRFLLDPRNPGSPASRAYPESEFLTSKDERFRPVFLETGPDGNLYLADMYTGIIEHKRFVTEYLREQVQTRDLGRFTATGRIYRIASTAGPTRRPASLAGMSAPQLAGQLSAANGWVRDTAQRLLVDAGDQSVVPDLKRIVADGPNALGRLHALWTLHGLGAVELDPVRTAVRDPDPAVRAAGLRMAERFMETAPDLEPALRSLAHDPAEEVRLQLLLSTGASSSRWAGILQVELLRNASVAGWEIPVVAATLIGRENEFLARVLSSPNWAKSGEGGTALLDEVGRSMMRNRDPRRVGWFLDLLAEQPRTDWRVSALLRGAASPRTATLPPVQLQAEPRLLSRLRTSGEPEDRRLAEALGAYIRWGKPPPSKMPPLTPKEQAQFELGKAQYALICAACHQPGGHGLAAVAPALAGSQRVTGPARALIDIVLHGLTGPIEVNGETWNLTMPGLGGASGALDDEKIAAILTFVRRSWGNEAAAVTPPEVAARRRATAGRLHPWTAVELRAMDKP